MLTLMAAAARRLLAAECCSFLEGVDPDSERWAPYQRWLHEVFRWAEDTVVTFNYDLVPEMLAQSQLVRERFQYRTKEPGANEPGYSPLLKLHGSVNWLLQSTLAVKTDADDRAALTCDDSELAIAGPGPSKQKLSSGRLQWCWTEALAALEKAAAIIFVGYRFPPTDAEARGKLLGAIRKNKDEHHLAIHTVLGPNTSSDDSRRLQASLGQAQIVRFHHYGDERHGDPKPDTARHLVADALPIAGTALRVLLALGGIIQRELDVVELAELTITEHRRAIAVGSVRLGRKRYS
jgi:hypothetical protein